MCGLEYTSVPFEYFKSNMHINTDPFLSVTVMDTIIPKPKKGWKERTHDKYWTVMQFWFQVRSTNAYVERQYEGLRATVVWIQRWLLQGEQY